MKLLDGKTAIITGAAGPRGLGKSMAKLFSDHGARISILDLASADPETAAKDVGSDHIGLSCDVTNRDQCETAVAETIRQFGSIDILVNNAGITQPNKIQEIDRENYDAVLDVNLRGTFNMCQLVVGHMKERKSGSIINVSSISAQRGGGIFGGPHYAAAKSGVLGLSKALAREVAPFGVRSNAICPGYIDTDIIVDKLTPEMKQKILAGIPMGRAGEATDVAGCALFLASDLSVFVTGIALDVNGGSHIH